MLFISYKKISMINYDNKILFKSNNRLCNSRKLLLNVCFERYILTAEKIGESGKSIEIDEALLYK